MDKILQFFSNNKDALTSIGIILTFSVSAISLYFSVRNNKAVHYVNSVTKNRVDWIYKFRDLVSEFIAMVCIENITFFISSTNDDIEKSGKHLLRTKELSNSIKLMLNFSDKTDRKIINLVSEIMDLFSMYYHDAFECEIEDEKYFEETENMHILSDKMKNDITELTKLVQIYLKSEWNRIKYESKGKIYEKDTQKFDVWELEQKYDNPNYKNNVWKRFCVDSKAKIRRIWNSVEFAVIVFIVGIIVLIIIA